jgi:hypothetical protein
MKMNVIKMQVGQDVVGNYALFPSYNSDFEAANKLKVNTHYRAEIKKPRNLKHHNKFIAICRLVVANTDKWDTVDKLIMSVKYSLGLVDWVMDFQGEVRPVPQSMNFESMDEIDFTEKVYGPALRLFADELKCSVVDLEDNFGEYM